MIEETASSSIFGTLALMLRRMLEMHRVIATLVGLSMIAAACGGGSPQADVAQTGPTTTNPAPTSPPAPTSTIRVATTLPPTTAVDVVVAPSTTATTTTVDVPPTLPREMEPKYSVVLTEGLTGPDTQDIVVWAPDADGPWPVVIFLAGWEGKGIHYARTAEMLAGQGVVVFAPDYRSQDIVTSNWKNPYRDAECAYRHIRTVASDFGGDIDQPITIAGHSLGAQVAMALALFETEFGPEGSFDRCEGDVPRPDRVLALAGCHLRSGVDGRDYPFTPNDFGWGHTDAAVHLVVGSKDRVCENHGSPLTRQRFSSPRGTGTWS